MDNKLIHRGTSGYGWTLYVGSEAILEYRLEGETISDNEEMLAQGRFRDNKRKIREFNGLRVFSCPQSAEEYARLLRPEAFDGATHWMPEDDK